MDIIYNNYHRHSSFSNLYTTDSPVSVKDYCERAKELGHHIIASTEHGWVGDVFVCRELAKKYDLKLVVGAEFYFVKDRKTDDKTNAHMVVMAMNENGREAINSIQSEANLSGFYYKPRIDLELLTSLPEDDVVVTTACIGGIWKYEDSEDILVSLLRKFKSHLYLEVQPHDNEQQRDLNRTIVALSRKYNIPLIAGTDSHYIYPEQEQLRSDLIETKGIKYEDETNWYMDYPDGNTLYKRFANQSVLTHEEIMQAIGNTMIFDGVEEYNCPIFNDEIKLPTLYPDWTQEQKDNEYRRLVMEGWDKYKVDVPEDRWDEYIEEINKEMQVVIDTHFSDYFLIDYYIIKRGKELGGILTKSGRGSAPSFFTNTLLGFSDIDRLSAPVKMYAERFASTTRILQSRVLFDIDLNEADTAPFVQAQAEVVGQDHSYPMVAYGTLKKSAAWKLYAKSQGVPFEIANAISERIGAYEKAVKHAAEDEKDSIDINKYIGKEYIDIYSKSADYLGLISSWSIAPCSSLIYQGSISREIGLVKIKDAICVGMDGHAAESGHFLKNDHLVVKVWELIDKAYKKAKLPVPSVRELLDMCPPEDLAWSIYERGATIGINQCEQDGTRTRVMKYKPHNIAELSAFVAAIRPGGASYYKQFESREPFSYGIKTIDDLIQTPQFPYSFITTQEQVMKILAYAGIDMGECYTAIKHIAKKRAEKVLAYKNRFMDGFREAIIRDEGKSKEEAQSLAETFWKVIEDASGYSFNCVSGDTRLMRNHGGKNIYCPTIDEMYRIRYDSDYAKATNHLDLHKKYCSKKGYGSSYSFFDGGRVKPNKVVDIRQAGEKQLYLVKTKSGKSIECTAEHKILTRSGYAEVKNLSAGNEILVCGNFDRQNDGFLTTSDKIKSISPTRIAMTYDVEMSDPAHNFAVDNGIIVSNCSHAYCVAIDSLYGSWIKAHYPLEFYETYINLMESKGDKDKIQAAKEEAESFFGIRFAPFKFGQDNRAIHADKEKNEMVNTIGSIKGFGVSVGRALYDCGKNNRESFIDVLADLDKRGIKEAKYKPLIFIDYFDAFGNQKELLDISFVWNVFKQGEIKTIKRASVPEEFKRSIESHSTWKCKSGKDSASYTFNSEEDVMQCLKEIESIIKHRKQDDLPLKVKIQNFIDVLGYCDIRTGKESDRKRLIIQDVTPIASKDSGEIWSYRVSTRSVGSGRSARLTIKKDDYNASPIEKGNIVYANDVYKNPKGYWYLTKYSIEA